MNVIKCTNGHFFDSERYQTCPHCGASPIDGAVSAPAETKKSVISFWGRKKNESVNNQVAPDKSIGKTFAMFDDAIGEDDATVIGTSEVIEQPERTAEVPAESPAVEAPLPPNFIVCENCHQSYNKALGRCPHCKCDSAPAQSEANVPASPAPAQTAAPIPPAPIAPVSRPQADPAAVQNSIKKEIAGGGGKTVGFFSAPSVSKEDAEAVVADPVVGWLVCIGGKHFGAGFSIFAGKNSVGRGEDNRIVVPLDNSISRSKHAFIVYEQKKRNFYLQPGDSSGLTYLNDEYVTESKLLSAKDTIELGDSKFLFIPLCNEDFSWEEFMPKVKD